MIYKGTPGRVLVVPVDPNNSRIDLDIPALYTALAAILAPGGIPPAPAPAPAPVPAGAGTEVSLVSALGGTLVNLPSLVLQEGDNITFGVTTNNQQTTALVNAPTDLRVTDTGLDTTTIDQLNAASAALMSHEYEVYDPAGTPAKSQKVTGTQIVAMMGGNFTRQIKTTAPMTGGGTLTADLTLAVPVFVASGASHASGLVPDPGASAGTTHFLREDATWQVPPYVPTSRKINTTAPMTGGGTLTSDLTLAVPVFVASGASHASGLVPDPGASAGSVKLLREDGGWHAPSNLLYDVSGNAILQVTTETTGKMLASIGANNLLLGANGAISFIVYGGNVFDPNSKLVFDFNHFFYDINSTQILAAQQPAIADASGVLTDDTRAINDILVALRTHGLIAT